MLVLIRKGREKITMVVVRLVVSLLIFTSCVANKDLSKRNYVKVEIKNLTDSLFQLDDVYVIVSFDQNNRKLIYSSSIHKEPTNHNPNITILDGIAVDNILHIVEAKDSFITYLMAHKQLDFDIKSKLEYFISLNTKDEVLNLRCHETTCFIDP